MTKRKKLFFTAASLMCVATVGVVVHAANKSAPIGDIGDGNVSVPSRMAVYASTIADSTGISGDFISVNFEAYTFGSTIWGPIDDEGNEIGPVFEYDGETHVYAENADAGAIQEVDSYHRIKRGNDDISITIHGTTPG